MDSSPESSPKPFREPEGMTTIELNHFNCDDTLNGDRKPNFRRIWMRRLKFCSTLAFIGILSLGCALVLFLLIECDSSPWSQCISQYYEYHTGDVPTVPDINKMLEDCETNSLSSNCCNYVKTNNPQLMEKFPHPCDKNSSVPIELEIIYVDRMIVKQSELNPVYNHMIEKRSSDFNRNSRDILEHVQRVGHLLPDYESDDYDEAFMEKNEYYDQHEHITKAYLKKSDLIEHGKERKPPFELLSDSLEKMNTSTSIQHETSTDSKINNSVEETGYTLGFEEDATETITSATSEDFTSTERDNFRTTETVTSSTTNSEEASTLETSTTTPDMSSTITEDTSSYHSTTETYAASTNSEEMQKKRNFDKLSTTETLPSTITSEDMSSTTAEISEETTWDKMKTTEILQSTIASEDKSTATTTTTSQDISSTTTGILLVTHSDDTSSYHSITETYESTTETLPSAIGSEDKFSTTTENTLATNSEELPKVRLISTETLPSTTLEISTGETTSETATNTESTSSFLWTTETNEASTNSETLSSTTNSEDKTSTTTTTTVQDLAPSTADNLLSATNTENHSTTKISKDEKTTFETSTFVIGPDVTTSTVMATATIGSEFSLGEEDSSTTSSVNWKKVSESSSSIKRELATEESESTSSASVTQTEIETSTTSTLSESMSTDSSGSTNGDRFSSEYSTTITNILTTESKLPETTSTEPNLEHMFKTDSTDSSSEYFFTSSTDSSSSGDRFSSELSTTSTNTLSTESKLPETTSTEPNLEHMFKTDSTDSSSEYFFTSSTDSSSSGDRFSSELSTTSTNTLSTESKLPETTSTEPNLEHMFKTDPTDSSSEYFFTPSTDSSSFGDRFSSELSTTSTNTLSTESESPETTTLEEPKFEHRFKTDSTDSSSEYSTSFGISSTDFSTSENGFSSEIPTTSTNNLSTESAMPETSTNVNSEEMFKQPEQNSWTEPTLPNVISTDSNLEESDSQFKSESLSSTQSTITSTDPNLERRFKTVDTKETSFPPTDIAKFVSNDDGTAESSMQETALTTVAEDDFNPNSRINEFKDGIIGIINKNRKSDHLSGKSRLNSLQSSESVHSSQQSQLVNVPNMCQSSTGYIPITSYPPMGQDLIGLQYVSKYPFMSPLTRSNMAQTYYVYPPVYSNAMSSQQSINSYYPIQTPASTLPSPMATGQMQVTDQKGQYYICNPIPPPVNSISGMPGVEIRQNAQDEDNEDDGQDWNVETTTQSNNSTDANRGRASSANCEPDEIMCSDGSACLPKDNWCDDIVQCTDASDELRCRCVDRIDDNKKCDGYFDCPSGEDELGCFGCPMNHFSCDDWTRKRKRATCVPLSLRCDGEQQCPSGKDEDECSLLSPTIEEHKTFKMANSFGFLHRNYKGRWYPICSFPDNWAMEACVREIGPSSMLPKIEMVPTFGNYKGSYIEANEDVIQLIHSCRQGWAVHVTCPPIMCGMRSLPPPNPFRSEEVDTSAEEIIESLLTRQKRNFTDTILGASRVVGGKPSQPGSWPWIVAIYRNGAFHCGGVLISDHWILTAAHCADKYWMHYYEIQAGILRRFSYSPMEQSRVVTHVISHEGFDRHKLKNDLAMMRLDAPFVFNRYVRPMCLPENRWEGPRPGEICVAVGWGAMQEHGPDPDHLREVQVPVLSKCKHKEDEEGEEICAGFREGGKDACQGDSGGPFMCKNPTNPMQWYVAGIVSHGEGCARPNEPGVYTRVSLYLEWIAHHARDDHLPKRAPRRKCPGMECSGNRRCISLKKVCNHVIDCLEGEDEMNCKERKPFETLFQHYSIVPLFRESENYTKIIALNETLKHNRFDNKLIAAVSKGTKENVKGENVTEDFQVISINGQRNINDSDSLLITVTTFTMTNPQETTGTEHSTKSVSMFTTTNTLTAAASTVNEDVRTDSEEFTTVSVMFSERTEDENTTGAINDFVTSCTDSTTSSSMSTESSTLFDVTSTLSTVTEGKTTVVNLISTASDFDFKTTSEEFTSNIITTSTTEMTATESIASTEETTTARTSTVTEETSPVFETTTTETSTTESTTFSAFETVTEEEKQEDDSRENEIESQENKSETTTVMVHRQVIIEADDDRKKLPVDSTTTNEIQATTETTSILTTTKTTTQKNAFRDLMKELIMDTKDTIMKHLKIFPVHRNVTNSNYTYVSVKTVPADTKFKCTKILEAIDASKRCDQIVDCQDASDEEMCSCADYLVRKDPEAICDGVTDCADLSDEHNCFSCNENEYKCRLSKTCINKTLVCDGTVDCPQQEDERDCFALTDGKFMLLDADLRPTLNYKGIISMNQKGTWYPICKRKWKHDESHSLASTICAYLGFGDLNGLVKAPTYNQHLKTSLSMVHDHRTRSSITTDEKCTTFHAKCSNDTYSMNINQLDRFTLWPWLTEIYHEGNYRCMGALLSDKWVAAARTCFGKNLNLRRNYVAVLLGAGNRHRWVHGPYEQIRTVNHFVPFLSQNVILLRLSSPVTFNRYVRPVNLKRKKDFNKNEKCVAPGIDEQGKTKSVILEPLANCSGTNVKCYRRLDKSGASRNCSLSNSNQGWIGVITCETGGDWYVTSIFEEESGSCGFQSIVSFQSVESIKDKIGKTIEKDNFDEKDLKFQAAVCDGLRCDLGKCISGDKVCDGVQNCRDGADERQSACEQRQRDCHHTANCGCVKAEMRCSNGKCVHKSTFCDGKNDCGDWSDEPAKCTCAAFLKLVAPEKICNGQRNCIDRSDEDPKLCNCTYQDKYICKTSNLCIPNDMVCDGIPDCPEKEDEEICLALQTVSPDEKSGSGEVIIRTSGMWHSGCFEKQMSKEELKSVCKELGYPSENPQRRYDTLDPALYPSKDTFTVIKLHHGKAGTIFYRPGNKPFVTLNSTLPLCHRLFIDCL